MSHSNHLKSKLLKATSTIAMRLRLVFVLIGLVTAAAGIIAILHARIILSAHSELNQSALPMLTLAQRTERDLNAMFLVLENIDTRNTLAELDEVKFEIDNKTERVRQNLRALREFDASLKMIVELDGRLREEKASSLNVLQHRATLLALQDQVSEIVTRLETLHDNSQHILDSLSFDLTSQMNALIRTPERKTDKAANLQIDQINALFIASLNISHIGHALDGIASLTNNPGTLHNIDESSRARLLVNAKIQDITNRLTQLPAGANRLNLARHVAEIRNLLAPEGDFFARLRSQFQFQQEFESNRAAHLPLMVEISNMSTDLLDRALAKVENTSQRLNSAVYQLVWVLTVAFLTALVTISLTNHSIIEQQFNRRIQSLNHSVTAIATGDLDHPITITGPDELGDMARALAVFKQTAEDLKNSNVELEKFAYVAAHDLRSPLRAIHDLSTWTMEDGENVLSGESQAYLTLLQERVDRLNKLLSDLLAYARVGQDEPTPENIDLAQLVKEQALYADPENCYGVHYRGDAISIVTQRTPLQQIIGNLLNNAVKHHDRPRGHICVTAECTGTMLSLAIADDGPGIEPQYQAKIFDLFQTLRPRDEVEGSGLGLAIVKKLTAQQKGKIELFSDPQAHRGATFEVILPLSETAQSIHHHRPPVAA